FFSSRRRHTRSYGDWSSDVCSSDLEHGQRGQAPHRTEVGRPAGEAAPLLVQLPGERGRERRLPGDDGRQGVLAGRDLRDGALEEIGRASCREGGESGVVAGARNAIT